MPDIWHYLRNLNNVSVLFYPMLPDFRKKNFQISTLCPSGKSNMFVKQAVHKVTNTVLEHDCNTDWPLGVSPCLEADNCSCIQVLAVCYATRMFNAVF